MESLFIRCSSPHPTIKWGRNGKKIMHNDCICIIFFTLQGLPHPGQSSHFFGCKFGGVRCIVMDYTERLAGCGLTNRNCTTNDSFSSNTRNLSYFRKITTKAVRVLNSPKVCYYTITTTGRSL